ncbi:hypothetical protein K493DRAFT_350485 [Basidiobolus meristosporus CBS 931.73]|uniref:SH3 domain-containing protein n=1 Tax=Basidiobolus meristosporus CBS 931.73 TaxID=1314790 RepID=A0A1Y1YGQ3_9FUNG|nr:hypothetical protein K493DRAFT_350485 [Basidiobolus meristosporus CBS 931.73]|eukprot:ORX96824.1 hypothetical protein K493DRAFT_350485 [Basidiobolus meristosporus CBS 931.73]
MNTSDPVERHRDPQTIRHDHLTEPDLSLHKSPLYLGGLALATGGWIISFVCTIVLGSSGFTWWVVVFTLVLLLMALAALFTKTVWHYRFPLLTFTAAVVGLLIFQIDDTIYAKTRSIIGLGCGSLITAVGLAPWLFLLGRDDDLDSTHVVGHEVTTHRQPMVQARNPSTPAVAPIVPPVAATTTPKPASAPSDNNYPYRAQALYGYEASADDPNEISFLKDEVVDVADTKGKWWQAKKSDGSVGIVPKIAQALGLSTEGLRPDLEARIKAYLNDNDIRNDPHILSLLNASLGSTPRKRNARSSSPTSTRTTQLQGGESEALTPILSSRGRQQESSEKEEAEVRVEEQIPMKREPYDDTPEPEKAYLQSSYDPKEDPDCRKITERLIYGNGVRCLGIFVFQN